MEGNFMLKEYFKIIRNAIQENRKKNQGIYYESHHIIPKSFNKKSKLVLLTPEEHYKCHKILALEFKSHSIYGKSMLWAYHRLSYDKKRKLSEEEYGEARRILMDIWKKPKTEKHKSNISKSMVGNNNNKNYKGMKSKLSDKGRAVLSEKTKNRLLGKVGLNATASKGVVIYENLITGEKIEEGSVVQLSKKVGIPQSTLSVRINNGSDLKGYRVYYKQ